MRRAWLAFLAGVTMATLANAAMAAAGETPPASDPDGVCLQANQIDHTHAPSNRELLVYMKNGKVWRNTLQRECTDLKLYDSVRWDIRGGTICANKQVFYTPFGNACFLGPFSPYTPPASGK